MTSLAGKTNIARPVAPVATPARIGAAAVGTPTVPEPTAGPWDTIASLPSRITDQGSMWFAAGNGTRIIVVGSDAISPASQVSEYDPGTDSFSDLSDAPIQLSYRHWQAFDETTGLLIVGARDPDDNTDHTLSYDFSTDTWTDGLSLPSIPRNNCIAGGVGGFVYIADGVKNSDTSVTHTGEAYDIGGDSWSSISSIPTLSGFGFQHWDTATGLDGLIYCAYSQNADFLTYDPGTDTWANPGGPFSSSEMVRCANGIMFVAQQFVVSWGDSCAVFDPDGMVDGTADDAPFVGPAVAATSGNNVYIWGEFGAHVGEGASCPVTA